MPVKADAPVFVVTGPSGAGKGTLIKLVLPRFPALALAVSATTRARRPGEEDGVDYWFLDRSEFERRVYAGEFLEEVDYVGNRYGTLQSEIDRLREQGKSPVLELETDGALRVAERVPGAVTIFVTAPVEELERRLRERATESSGEIGERIATARRQLELLPRFDHVVANVDREHAADELAAVIAPMLTRAATMARP
ncbi:MAG TPA: guanylate kinase [Casimicrobiaceae bacterium]|nr:guanylate kinase [Casimicrobiaceae bacterium]